MSLVGNLEDLGLGEILQIVSLSRKSGVLSLQSQTKQGKIYFREGQVIRANSSSRRENLGELLLRRKLVDLPILKEALTLQQQEGGQRRIGAILGENFDISREAIEEAVKEQIEKIVYAFFSWEEGTFSFALGEPEELGETSFNPLQFMLEQGLNPQWLAMEGSRLLDEKRHRGEPLEEEEEEASLIEVEDLLGPVAEKPAAVRSTGPAEAAPAGESTRSIYLIDDDEIVRRELGRIFEQKGFDVEVFKNADEFLPAFDQAIARGTSPALVIDLIMPRMDGSGILGGLELLEQVRERSPEGAVALLSEHPNPDAEKMAQRLGAPVLAKPKRSELAKAGADQTLEAVAGLVLERLRETGAARRKEAEGPGLFNLGAELRREFGEDDLAAPPGKGPESPGLHLLRGMLMELNNPSLGGGIILLVLRFASEIMNRAVVFAVKEDEIVGLGQFGIEIEGESADARIRRVRIPRGEPSVFSALLAEQVAMKVTLGDNAWDDYIGEQLGGMKPAEVFLGPILSEGKVVAILYGDNLPERAAIGDTEALEIFLSQAGLAMEKALLERRLRNKDGS